MKLLLDNNSFDFLLENIDKIELILNENSLYYIYAQELELKKLDDSHSINKKKLYKSLNKIKGDYCNEAAGVFMLNAPCLNRECFFPDKTTLDEIFKILKKHGCLKNNRLENFAYNL